jgi:hypothetical protein
MVIMVERLRESLRRLRPISDFIYELLSLKTAAAFLAVQLAVRKASSFLQGELSCRGQF